jgi:hypothetical protein
MTPSGRIVCRVRVKTIADRRTSRLPATVPFLHSEFSDDERRIFRTLDRRKGRSPSPSEG